LCFFSEIPGVNSGSYMKLGDITPNVGGILNWYAADWRKHHLHSVFNSTEAVESGVRTIVGLSNLVAFIPNLLAAFYWSAC